MGWGRAGLLLLLSEELGPEARLAWKGACTVWKCKVVAEPRDWAGGVCPAHCQGPVGWRDGGEADHKVQSRKGLLPGLWLLAPSEELSFPSAVLLVLPRLSLSTQWGLEEGYSRICGC